eukprot:5081869-Pyramimonas_sp.AAC.1
MGCHKGSAATSDWNSRIEEDRGGSRIEDRSRIEPLWNRGSNRWRIEEIRLEVSGRRWESLGMGRCLERPEGLS